MIALGCALIHGASYSHTHGISPPWNRNYISISRKHMNKSKANRLAQEDSRLQLFRNETGGVRLPNIEALSTMHVTETRDNNGEQIAKKEDFGKGEVAEVERYMTLFETAGESEMEATAPKECCSASELDMVFCADYGSTGDCSGMESRCRTFVGATGGNQWRWIQPSSIQD